MSMKRHTQTLKKLGLMFRNMVLNRIGICLLLALVVLIVEASRFLIVLLGPWGFVSMIGVGFLILLYISLYAETKNDFGGK